MQTNCEAEAITSIYSPSVLWLSSYTSRRCSPALWQSGGGSSGGGVGGQHPTKDGWCGRKGTVGEKKDAGHGVIRRVVSPCGAAGRWFSTKQKKKRNKSCWYIKEIWNKEGCFMKLHAGSVDFSSVLDFLKEHMNTHNTHTHTWPGTHTHTHKHWRGLLAIERMWM